MKDLYQKIGHGLAALALTANAEAGKINDLRVPVRYGPASKGYTINYGRANELILRAIVADYLFGRKVERKGDTVIIRTEGTLFPGSKKYNAALDKTLPRIDTNHDKHISNKELRDFRLKSARDVARRKTMPRTGKR